MSARKAPQKYTPTLVKTPFHGLDPTGRQEEDDIPFFIHPIVGPPESFLQQMEDYEYLRFLLEEQVQGAQEVRQQQQSLEQLLNELRNENLHELHRDGGLCYKDEPTSPPPPAVHRNLRAMQSRKGRILGRSGIPSVRQTCWSEFSTMLLV
jgi:hypothetical protein